MWYKHSVHPPVFIEHLLCARLWDKYFYMNHFISALQQSRGYILYNSCFIDGETESQTSKSQNCYVAVQGSTNSTWWSLELNPDGLAAEPILLITV